MPPAVGLIVGAVLSGVVSWAVGVAVLGIAAGTFAAFAVGFAGTLVLSIASRALTPALKMANLASFSVRQNQQTTLIRQPITHWRSLFGEAMISGPMTFYESTDDNKYHHLVIVLAHHEIQAIKAVYFNDEPIYDADLDGSGNVTSGKYSGKARIKKHLGASGQTADADLISEVTKLDSNFKGTDCAYIYVRIQTDRDLFPSIIPSNIKVWAKGKKLLDTRDAGTRWSPNPSLGIRDYLTDTSVGRRVVNADVDDTTVTSAANVCEEMVATKAVSHDVETADASGDFLDLDGERLKFFTGDRVQGTTTGTLPAGLFLTTNYFVIHVHELKSDSQKPRIQLATTYANALAETAIDITDAGTGTHTITRNAEPRYTMNGIVDTTQRPSDILEEMRWSMAGFVPHNGPKWTVLAGAYVAPSFSFDEGDLRGPIQRRGKHSRRSRFNAVKGVYASHLNAGQASDYPIVTDSTYQTADGGDRVFTELDMPFTNRPSTAKRIAKITLERHRQEQTFDAVFNLSGFQIQAGDNVQITNSRRSWTDKVFFVEGWGFKAVDQEDGPALFTLASLRETTSTIYDWDETVEEVIVEPAPILSPLDPLTVGNPTNLVLASGTTQLDLRLDGTVFSRIKVSWTAPADEYVLSGGRIELQFKKSADSTWLPHRFVDGATTEDFILDVKDGDDYDVRVHSINQLGIRASTWVTESNHTVIGKTTVPSDVTGFSAVLEAGGVRLTWTIISDKDLGHYEIREGTVWGDGNHIARIKTNSHLDTQITAAGTSDWMIKAVDTSGNLSDTEDTAQLVITAPAAPATLTLASGTIHLHVTDSGDIVARIFADWAIVNADFLDHYELQWKTLAAGDYQSRLIGLDITDTYISPVAGGVDYDVRIRGVTSYGLKGTFKTVMGHTVIGKTEVPSDVTGFLAIGRDFDVLLSWYNITDVDLDHYEIRRGTVWNSATFEANVDGTSLAIDVLAAGTHDFLIKAFDTSGNESSTEDSASIAVTGPGTPAISLVFNGGNFELSWTTSTGSFAIRDYEVRRGGSSFGTAQFVTFTDSTIYIAFVDWKETKKWWVRAIDIAGNIGSSSSIDLVIMPPSMISLTVQVIDNTVLLRWSGMPGTLPIDTYDVRKGTIFGSAETIGTANTTFATIIENVSGIFTYWISPIDTAGNFGTEVGIIATVDEPPDFVLNTQELTDWVGDLSESNIKPTTVASLMWDDDDTMLMWNTIGSTAMWTGFAAIASINLTETIDDHFVDNSFASPQEQIDAGLLYWIEPTLSSASIEEELDVGTVLAGSRIIVDLDTTVIDGAPTTQITIATKKLLSDSYVDISAGSMDVFATNFQFVRIKLDVTTLSDRDFIKLNRMLTTLRTKLRNDAGQVTVNANPTTVDFNVTFIDIKAIVLTPEGTVARIPVLDFTDTPNPTSFDVYLFDAAGAAATGDVRWTARGF